LPGEGLLVVLGGNLANLDSLLKAVRVGHYFVWHRTSPVALFQR
jgi:hypothetical protein